MTLKLHELSLVLLIGTSGSGKSTFARRHFKESEIISSDACRALVADDENDQSATPDAFDVLYYIAAKRLKNGLLTVIDATNVRREDREQLIKLAREYYVFPSAIVFNIPEKICIERNARRTDRQLPPSVVHNQYGAFKRSVKHLKEEGLRPIYTFRSEEEVNAVESIIREPLYNNKKHERGPFDIIGDVHGCFDELVFLLKKLGYYVEKVNGENGEMAFDIQNPVGRKAIFVGDLVDRGPDTPSVLRLVMQMVKENKALCVIGNHDDKFKRMLMGKNVELTHGLAESKAQMEATDATFKEAVIAFIDGLISHYVLDDGRLVVAHAGIRAEMQGRGHGSIREFCMYGETTGETDEFGLPIRYNWAADYRGKAMVVYGHTPVPTAQWLNNTIDIDTGCVFGGKLTALRYPEKELVSVEAARVYTVPRRPLEANAAMLSLQAEHDEVPDLADFLDKMHITCADGSTVIIREHNAAAAMETMSRFAVNPKWLIYLPPTMSPAETSRLPDYLEHPHEAFEYYRENGIECVICEEKHMGSRAIVVIAKDAETVRTRFGIDTADQIGVCYTRTGRAFFNDETLEKQFLNRLKTALDASDFWSKHQTNWVCLDCELMPWSAKAQGLLQSQYAAVGSASRFALQEVVSVLAQNSNPAVDTEGVLQAYQARLESATQFTEAYRRYCWTVQSLDDYRLAPFHILATEGGLHTDKNHLWHIENIHALCAADPTFLLATAYRVVDVFDDASVAAATDWWLQLTAQGGEGMVVKSLDFIPQTAGGIKIQPAIKVRGREYLRIIYGAEYTLPQHLERLKNRGLRAKRSLALREFQLGVEGLRRFVNHEPLRQYHACVFGVMALESEPIDPRL